MMLNAQMTMAEALRQVTQSRPAQEALVCGEVRETYTQLLAHSESLAGGLHHLGVGKGDRIVCCLPPGPEFVYLFFAIARLGAVIVPLNPQIRLRGLINVLQQVKPLGLVSAVRLDEDLINQVPGLAHVIWAGEGEARGLSLASLISSGEAAPLSQGIVSPLDTLALLYTSGTTGQPKGAIHSHSSLIAPVAASMKLRELWLHRLNLGSLGQTARALVRYRGRLLRAAGRSQTFLSTVSWHTITGLEIMLQGLLMGDRLVILPRFHPREALRLVEQERVTVLVAVPMAYQVMLKLENFKEYDTSSLLICGTGAAPCPPDLARQIQQGFGCALHIGFGATETAGGIAATSIADSNERQATTVGRPMPGIQVRIVDEERHPLPPGQVGELACRSDSLMQGYFGDQGSTAKVLDEEGWYYTGDLAVMDEKGYLQIVGRKKEMIIRGGQNIFPVEVEHFLVSHPKIREAAVIGVPSALSGESVWAFILLENNVTMTAQEVLDYCRADLEPYKIPSQIRFVDEFPRSETGKPQKFTLLEQALRENPEVKEHGETA